MKPSLTVADLLQEMRTANPPALIDVRRRHAFEADPQQIVGALWLDPEQVTAWAPALAQQQDEKYCLTDPALQQLAVIVRGADTSRLDLTPQSAGLYALSLGLSQTFADDHEMLRHGLVMYDALYAWCKHCQAETHRWPPAM